MLALLNCRSKLTMFADWTNFYAFKIANNGLGLGEEADFEALNSLPALNLI
jgi:hypothetical protein